jgi:hypothetical protein
MAQLPRQDRYGAPRPELTDAQRQPRQDEPANVLQRRHIRAVLDRLYSDLLRRDIYATVSIEFEIVRGVIQSDLFVQTVRQYRTEGDE